MLGQNIEQDLLQSAAVSFTFSLLFHKNEAGDVQVVCFFKKIKKKKKKSL